MNKFKISIVDNKTIEVDSFERNPSLVPYREAILLARSFFNKEAPQRGQVEDADVERLAILLVRVMEGEKNYILNEVNNKLTRNINSFVREVNDDNRTLAT